MIVSEQYLKELLHKHYNMEKLSSIEKILGYEDQNFLIQDAEGKKLIAKVTTDLLDPYFLEAQLKAMAHLRKKDKNIRIQNVLANSDGGAYTVLEVDGNILYLRVLSYLDGTFMGDLKDCPSEVIDSLGTTLANMDLYLKDFSHPAAYRFTEWDLAQVMTCRDYLQKIKDHEKRTMVDYFLLQYEMEVMPLQHQLRKAVIHNDANDYNVLVKDGQVSGIIDFGDMVESQLINNIAIACTYVMFKKQDPLSAAQTLLKSYHRIYPLTETELSVLYYLIAARLCKSVTTSALQRSKSENVHHFISEKDAWTLLYQWIKINPLYAQNQFNLCCGYATVLGHEERDLALKTERKQVVGTNLSISYQKNLKITRGALQYLYDDKGDTYIDCVNNVSHVGHCHPVVVKTMQKQLVKLNTNTRYLHDSLVTYAKMLTATLPPKLNVCYFCNSGSEANDLAIRISRHFTKQKDVIVLDHAYHGTSTVAMELSPYKFDSKGGSGQQPYIHKGMNPDLYRGHYRYGDEHAGEKYAEDIADIIKQLSDKGTGIAAFICETLLGVGGQIPLPDGYLKAVYSHVRAAGGLCIADEVQVGFGRVGEKFWGFELQGVEPDIVVLGKPIGNGHPLAAVVLTEEIAAAFNNGLEYFNTYGGNPVSMETGIAVMNVISEEELQQRALETGNYLIEGLKKLMEKHVIIGDVRGKGLFVGAELVRNRETLEPAVPEIDVVVEQMRDRGFLISTDGPFHNVLKIKPPMVFNIENAASFLTNLDEVLGGL
ncbi:aminotransferase class III-fold pyridoxal phosphate-dependent enzyme [Pedobacter hiemivivus]|uniref:Aminotransferase class III-fold pyridoxal phosphate-dependent enzyme n=1 Tax=Pedobacter hiemivivus TaxID=2530454 RepID=A0A4R0NBV6_9SPHI|nr:aminotransferase class III-fold pyridoxal phosphate-dependent enzyme [Pedobacter hiemivivus]TCC97780.1 aminotransferase class III-fold pyridoxal phosphate-dependent enzyme [Pedobacter hiemivivus]